VSFLCIEILNSDRVDYATSKTRRDLLEDEIWMRALLERWQLEAPLPVPATVLGKMKELREQMYLILTGMPEKVDGINRILGSNAIRVRLGFRQNKYILDRAYDAVGWDFVLWSIAKSFADMLCTQDLSRIKICDNPECGWAFYDGSKNKSRRWCDDKTCGNLMKVRRYRERQRADGKCKKATE